MSSPTAIWYMAGSAASPPVLDDTWLDMRRKMQLDSMLHVVEKAIR